MIPRLAATLAILSALCLAAPAQDQLNLPPDPFTAALGASDEPVAAVRVSEESGAILEVTPDSASSPLTVAYLRGNDEIPVRPADFAALASTLLADPAVQDACRLAGRRGVEIIGTDSHEDLARRMDTGAFDLVFAPALIYARHDRRYAVLGQIRTPGTSGSGDRGGGLTQVSVIFVNEQSPLFNLENPRPELLDDDTLSRISTAIPAQPMAVVSGASAVGYVFPLIKLRQVFGIGRNPPLLWCDTAEETVMAVLNNLATIGACDEATFLRVVEEQVHGINPSTLITVILPTDPIPVAPLLLRRDLDAGPLREPLREAIGTFLEGRAGQQLDLEPASERPYQRLREQTDAFYAERGEP